LINNLLEGGGWIVARGAAIGFIIWGFLCGTGFDQQSLERCSATAYKGLVARQLPSSSRFQVCSAFG